MKQKDIAVLIIIAFVSGVVSFFGSKFLFKGDNGERSVVVVKPVTSDFQALDSRYFNADSFNPTKRISIGTNTALDPFKDAQ